MITCCCYPPENSCPLKLSPSHHSTDICVWWLIPSHPLIYVMMMFCTEQSQTLRRMLNKEARDSAKWTSVCNTVCQLHSYWQRLQRDRKKTETAKTGVWCNVTGKVLLLGGAQRPSSTILCLLLQFQSTTFLYLTHLSTICVCDITDGHQSTVYRAAILTCPT